MKTLTLTDQELKALDEAIQRAQSELDMYLSFEDAESDFEDDPDRVKYLRSLPEQWSALTNKIDMALYT